MADITPSGFESQRQLAAKTGDGLDMVISTGYALFGMKGLSGAWNRQDLAFQVGPWWAAVRGTTRVVSPSSMFNKNVANNAGWAVDRVDLTYFSQTPGPAGVRVELRCGLAVSDSDGILYRVNYHVTTIGRLASEPGVVLAQELTSAEDLVAASVAAQGAEPTA
jgi:hypothetical protein